MLCVRSDFQFEHPCSPISKQSSQPFHDTFSSAASINAAPIREESLLIKDFIEVIDWLLEITIFQNQRDLLKKIKILPLELNNIHSQLINIIKTLDGSTINTLKASVKPPKFFENIFEIADCERQFNFLMKNPNHENMFNIGDIAINFAKAGNVDRAIEVIILKAHKRFKRHNYSIEKQIKLFDLFNTIITTNNIDDALKCAKAIPSILSKNLAFSKIYDISIAQGRINKAIEATKMISEYYRASYTIRILNSLLKRNLIIKNLSKEDLNKKDLLLSVFETLLETQKIGHVVSIAELLPNNFSKDAVLCKILNFFEKHYSVEKHADRVIGIANLITNKDVKAHTLQNISSVLRQKGKIDFAIKAAKSIDDKLIQGTTLTHIFNDLMKEGQHDKAVKVAKSIRHKEIKKLNYDMISHVAAETGDGHRAVRFAQRISDFLREVE